MTEKTRLTKTLAKEKTERPPVICPGGMMSAAVTEVLLGLTENHFSQAGAMAQAAREVNRQIGFENLGVPFDMTVEAEEFGAAVDLGDAGCEARVTAYNPLPLRDALKQWKSGNIASLRSKAVLDAIAQLKNDDVAVIGNVTGPVSIATSIYEPVDIFKLYRKDPELLRDFFAVINDYLIDFSRRMIRAGADVIAMCDPTSTGEILGAKNFKAFSVPLYRDFAAAMHQKGIPVILHICGSAGNIIKEMDQTGADALSFDSAVSISSAKREAKTPIMGNVSTVLLSAGKPESIKTTTRYTLGSGVDILSPACGIGMETRVENLRALVDAGKTSEPIKREMKH